MYVYLSWGKYFQIFVLINMYTKTCGLSLRCFLKDGQTECEELRERGEGGNREAAAQYKYDSSCRRSSTFSFLCFKRMQISEISCE